MKYRQFFFSLCSLLAFFPLTSFAVPVDPSGSVWYTDEILNVGTYGNDMEGMAVTVTFSGNKEETVIWKATTPSGSGEAVGSGWSLAVTEGATYLNYTPSFKPWVFKVSDGVSISQLFIDAGTGNTVFDIVPPNTDPSTDGSESGSLFAYYGMDDPFNTTATYSGPVALSGSTPVGDLYRYLSIDFGTNTPLTREIAFSADTDTIKSALVVPEPSTLVLFGIGVAGLAGVASRKRRS